MVLCGPEVGRARLKWEDEEHEKTTGSAAHDCSSSSTCLQATRADSYLDVFDMLSPRYDSPQTIRALSKWFQEAGMIDVVVRYGYNGIEGRGRRAI